MNDTPLIQVDDLSLRLARGADEVKLLNGVTFAINPGEIVGLVGESGSGKTLTGLSMIRMEPKGARLSGSIRFQGEDLLQMAPADLRKVRGKDISMIFQENRSALNPCYPIGHQIADVLRAHTEMSRSEALNKAAEVLDRVRIPDAKRRLKSYPHELSGGMCQRAMIAMALVCSPKLLIADEPTTALDVTIQAQIVALFRELAEDLSMAVLLITHNLGVVAGLCDRAITLYAGEVVNDDATDHLVANPTHPYTWGLIGSAAGTDWALDTWDASDGERIGSAINLQGCRFHPRCKFAEAVCREKHPDLDQLGDGSKTRCWLSTTLEMPGVRT